MARPQCEATNAKGSRCRRPAVDGSDLCALHEHGRGGRPSLLTEPVADELVRLLGAGNYDDTAARAAGISGRTLRDWLRRGRQGESPYDELLERVEQARAAGEALHVARIAKAAQDGDWKASAFFLERAYPERWGRVAVRPAPPRESDESHAPDPDPVATPPGLFDEIDELAQKRAQRLP